jgi:hypothetical protein
MAWIRCLLLLPLLWLSGCRTLDERIEEHHAEFAALDAAAQANIRQGIVTAGYTTSMVYMAMGKPTRITADNQGRTVWLYRHEPETAYNETVQTGFRRRIVYDPVRRTDEVLVEPIDEKAFPHLVAYTKRLTFENDRLVSIERTR